MSLPVLNRRLVRLVDERAVAEFGMSSLVLMENAARGAVHVLMRLGCVGPIGIVCGKGNNAGDGFAMARHLDARGIETRVVLCDAPESLRGDAAANYAILAKSGMPMFRHEEAERRLSDCEWIVDALLGTGATGDPRPPYDAAIRLMNRMPGRKLAVDLPSGLDCNSGRVSPTTFHADYTVAFVAAKPGFFAEEAKSYVGELHVVDIGVPRILIEDLLRQADATRAIP